MPPRIKTFAAAALAALAALIVTGCTGDNEIFNIPLTSDREPEITVTPLPASKTPETVDEDEPSRSPSPVVVDLKCQEATKGEITRVKELVDIHYGGQIAKTAKVETPAFRLIATRIKGAIDGVVTTDDRPVNDRHPIDVDVTWVLFPHGDKTVSIEVEKNWYFVPGGEEYGTAAREKVLACLG
jgi:hypothetical protein